MINKYSLTQLLKYFLRLGAIGFGGPVALIGYMHQDLVEKKKWISNDDYREGLALSQLAPGPLAAQLSIYLGYVDYKLMGATLTGIVFVLPSFIMVLILGELYIRFNGLPWMQYIFYGVGPTVIAIISLSSYKLIKKTIAKDRLLWCLFLISMVATIINQSENIWLIILSGIVVLIYRSSLNTKRAAMFLFLHPFTMQILAPSASINKLSDISWFFFKAGAFVFGSGLAIIPFLYGGLVKETHWLTEQQFLDAVAVAMITPGPIVITVGFIGYLIAGFQGAAVASLSTFLPCYIFTVLPAPYFKKYGKNPGLKSFIEGVTTAAVGAIGGAVVVLATRQLIDVTTIIIFLITLLLLLRFKIPEPLIIAAAALSGLIIKSTF